MGYIQLLLNLCHAWLSAEKCWTWSKAWAYTMGFNNRGILQKWYKLSNIYDITHNWYEKVLQVEEFSKYVINNWRFECVKIEASTILTFKLWLCHANVNHCFNKHQMEIKENGSLSAIIWYPKAAEIHYLIEHVVKKKINTCEWERQFQAIMPDNGSKLYDWYKIKFLS